MKTGRYIGYAGLTLSIVFATATAATSQEPATLPGGASAITENFGDWTVECRMVRAGENSSRVCAISQRHVNEAGQRVLTVELQPTTEGARSTLILPFGLELSKGVVLEVDEVGVEAGAPFKTCLPAGCAVVTTFSDKTLSLLRKGGQLTLRPFDLAGIGLDFTVSLAGFGAAYDRVVSLASAK